MDVEVILFRILSAVFLGSIIGFERQWRRRNAGLRTNSLVSLGASLFVLISANIYGDDASPSRVASQVVTGIGFLGAGVILKEGFNIRGLNTAATLWCSAAIGSLAGLGFIIEAVFGSIAVILSHLVLRPLGNLIEKGPLSPGLNYVTYNIRTLCNKESEASIRAMIVKLTGNTTLQLRGIKRHADKDDDLIEIIGTIVSGGRNDFILEEILGILGLEEGVKKISWEIVSEEEPDD